MINFADPKANSADVFARDKKSKALINTDSTSFNAFKQNRQNVTKVNTISNKVDKLEKDMSDIKELLLKLVNGNNNG